MCRKMTADDQLSGLSTANIDPKDFQAHMNSKLPSGIPGSSPEPPPPAASKDEEPEEEIDLERDPEKPRIIEVMIKDDDG